MATNIKTTERDVKGSSFVHKLRDLPGFDEGRKLQAQILELGDKVRMLREDVLKISQTEAAGLIGIDQSDLSRIENGVGNRGPSYAMITRIIEAYQSFMQKVEPSSHLALNIQFRRGEADEVEQSTLAGSNG